MDEKGYAFTPAAVLLFIPILIIAISYGNLISELNTVSSLAIGGDVTFGAASNIYMAIEKGAADAGRNSAYNATRKVIDDRAFMTDSKTYIKNNVISIMNEYVIRTCQNLEIQTGRQIYINNISITNTTYQVFRSQDVTITQSDPYGFYVNIAGGIPVRVVQNDQTFEGTTPPMNVYVSIEGLEDPYIWMNTKQRSTSVIYKYPYYSPLVRDYHFHDIVEPTKLHYLWESMNGTGNPSEIYPRPYYFPDNYGLSFFDRLENKTNSSSTSPIATRMSTWILGDPLQEEHGSVTASNLDHEYIFNVPGYPILIGSGSNQIQMRQPDSSATPNGPIFYLSSTYKVFLDLNAARY
jgi:hypothetical protein